MRFIAPFLAFASYLAFALLFTDRSNFPLLLGFYLAFWLFYLYLVYKETYRFRELIFIAMALRLPFFLNEPVLSEDVYRFIWDGLLSLRGQNPYTVLPSAFSDSMPTGLFHRLNSPEYYSVYPPVKQLVFVFAAFLGNGSVQGSLFFLRLILLLTSLAVIWLIREMLLVRGEKEADSALKWYAFNPLLILETVGNIHFEEFMGLFLISSWYLFVKRKRSGLAAVCYALACSVKLLPLMLAPLIWRKTGFKPGLHFLFLAAVVFLLLFIPFLGQGFPGTLFSSIDLYFHKFEFNASVYYLIRELGFLLAGFNIISFAGPLLALSGFLIILKLSLEKRPLASASLLIFFTYLLLATTVHPWYLLTPLLFSVFSPYRYIWLWSFTVIFSYAAYRPDAVQEQGWLLLLEYLPVLGLFVVENWGKDLIHRFKFL